MLKKLFCSMLGFLFFILNIGWVEAEVFEVTHIQGAVEKASGPSELLELEARDEITPRALMAFGKLPEEFVGPALQLRSAGVDLLRADMEELELYIEDARSGKIDADPDKLTELKSYMEKMDYLNWTQVCSGDRIAGDDLLRIPEGSWIVLQDFAGGKSRISSSGFFRITQDKLAFFVPEDVEIDADADKPTVTLAEPGTAPDDLSPRAARLYDYWAGLFDMEGFPLKAADDELLVDETPESIELKVHLVDYTLDDEEEMENLLRLNYTLINDEHMDFTVRLPQRIWMHDEQEMPVGLVVFTEHNIKGTWSDELEHPLELEFILSELKFLPDALNDGIESQEMLAVGSIFFHSLLDQKSESLWDARGMFHASNVSLFEVDGEELIRIGSLRYDMEVQDQNAEVFSGLIPAIDQMVEHDDMNLFPQLLGDMLIDYGDARLDLSVEELNLYDIEDIEVLSLGRFQAESTVVRSDADPETRNLHGEYSFQDFRLLSDEFDMSLRGFSVEAGCSGLDMVKTAMLLNFEQLVQENPFLIFEIFEELLDGVHLGFSIQGLQGSHEEIQFSGLDGLSMNLSLSGLKELILSLYLNYQHAGLEKMDETPPELTPENLSLGLKVSRVPVMEIIGPVMGAQASGPVILEILSRHDSQLEIEGLDVGFPGAEIRLKGVAYAQEQELPETGQFHVLLVDSFLDIQGLDHLAEVISSHMDNQEDVEILEAMVSFIKLAAEEQVQDDGKTLHHLRIESNKHGEITANGKDIQPLLNLISR